MLSRSQQLARPCLVASRALGAAAGGQTTGRDGRRRCTAGRQNLAFKHKRLLAPKILQESFGEKLKHAAEEAVHRAEDAIHRVEHSVEGAVHKVTDALHERRDLAREEAERGMYTADDIREAADQMLHSRGGQGKKTQASRQYQPDEEEQLLEDTSSDMGQSWRQKEMEGLRSAVHEDEGQATEAVRRAGQEYKKDHPQ